MNNIFDTNVCIIIVRTALNRDPKKSNILCMINKKFHVAAAGLIGFHIRHSFKIPYHHILHKIAHADEIGASDILINKHFPIQLFQKRFYVCGKLYIFDLSIQFGKKSYILKKSAIEFIVQKTPDPSMMHIILC